MTMYYLYNTKVLNPLKKIKLVDQLRHFTNYIFNRQCSIAESKNDHVIYFNFYIFRVK